MSAVSGIRKPPASIRRSGHGYIFGFTLLEAIVATTIVVLIFGLFFEFLIPGIKNFALSSVRTEIQQEALRSVHKIASDLDISVSTGVSIYTAGTNGPVYLGVVRLNTNDPVNMDGYLKWDNLLVVYSWKGPDQPLIRKVWIPPTTPPSPPLPASISKPTRFSEDVLSTIANLPNLKGQIMARHVKEFSITRSANGPPFTVSIEISRESPISRPTPGYENFRLSRVISMRNQI